MLGLKSAAQRKIEEQEQRLEALRKINLEQMEHIHRLEDRLEKARQRGDYYRRLYTGILEGYHAQERGLRNTQRRYFSLRDALIRNGIDPQTIRRGKGKPNEEQP